MKTLAFSLLTESLHLQVPCSLCDEAKAALDPLRHRVRQLSVCLSGLFVTDCLTGALSLSLHVCLCAVCPAAGGHQSSREQGVV